MSPAERRDDLISAALELYSSRAPELVSIEDIITHAEVSRALFYRYFGSLRELHVAALRTAVDELVDRLTRREPGTLLEQLRRALGVFVDVADTYATAYIALLRSGSVVATRDTDALVDEVRHLAVQEILDVTGVTEPSPFLLLTLRCWVAVVEGSLLIWLQERDHTREELIGWLIDQLAAMTAATATRDPVVAELLTRIAPEV
ncbi:TetR/AcrR family transcriptional regulator [Crossiella sp. CA-258035]|uniref:TetR/AcrR family transcriptional regulator n=1 Tax=Crossiella sp. CA-258035 TaxID=2981138 RepID=UPI0024BC9202|nr:TetR/AcrR family transcriptional regulator [Crossiella sp. CA-258035]WHT23553.1 TetR/AcrR family transcriptional regulator [Crossiella sp. CA-258035]